MGSLPTGSIPKSMCIFCFLVPCHCHHCLDKGKINPYPKLHFTAHENFFKKTLLWCCIFKHFYEECVLSSFLPRKGRYYCAPFKQVKRPRPQWPTGVFRLVKWPLGWDSWPYIWIGPTDTLGCPLNLFLIQGCFTIFFICALIHQVLFMKALILNIK